MKSKEELNALKADLKALSKRLGELTVDELSMVSGGTEEAFDKAQADILGLISVALANHWTRSDFQAEAESVVRNTPSLDSAEMMRLNQLIIILLSQLPA